MKDDNKLVEMLTEYYQKEAKTMPSDSVERYKIPHRVAMNMKAPEGRKVFPMSIIAKELEIKSSRVLDAGCGTGVNVVAFAREGATVTGIDIDELSLEIAAYRTAQEQLAVEIRTGDVTAMDFDDDSFDIVISHQVLEHVPSDEDQIKAVEEMWRVLAPGGFLFIQTPNRWFPIDSHDSVLPFAHWLPAKMSARYTELFNRIPSHVNLMNWREIEGAIGGEFMDALVNKCDVYHDLADFRKNKKAYTADKTWRSKLYFSFIPMIYYLSKVTGMPYVAFSPNLNMFIQKPEKHGDD